MSGLLTSLVAVFATLAGSALAFVFQRHAARQAERFTRNQQLWHERIAAYSAFAAALTDFRRSQNDRWHLKQAHPGSPELVAAREESYKLRAKATAAMCRVRLVCGNPRLSELAQDAINATIEVHQARDEQDRANRGEKARLSLDQFVADASAQIHGEPPPGAAGGTLTTRQEDSAT